MNKDTLESKLKDTFSSLNINRTQDGCVVSVPNGSRKCTIIYNGKLYIVKNKDFMTTYNNFSDACIEILESLVTRELFSNGFSVREINYVVSNILKK